ncbi:MAG TPA: SRPBCC domain-containing protein [Capsulimonadaceae bacterium]|jgi:uncharacterized protein YndB with AHSA1/START domain
MTDSHTQTLASLVVKRVLRAPVERVYRAWTDPAELEKWFSPNERWVQPKIDVENYVGGKHHITMVHSDTEEIPLFGKYTDLQLNKRVAFTWIPPEGMGTSGESLVTVDFAAVAGGTEVTLTHERLVDPEEREQTSGGWTGCLETLARYVDEGIELAPRPA